MAEVQIGTPLSARATRVMLLGSGELGKEVAIELQRLGIEVIAVDSYAHAPAMQVAHRSHVVNMLDADALRSLIESEKPHLIVPEVEAIATPIGWIPKFEDLALLFQDKVGKAYPEDLYVKQFSLYIDKITARIDLLKAAYGKEANVPKALFEVLEEQREGLMALKEAYGSVVTPIRVAAFSERYPF